MILFPYKKVVIKTELSERSIIFELKLNSENLYGLNNSDKAFIGGIKDDNIKLRVSEITNDSMKQRPFTILDFNIIDKKTHRNIEVKFRPSNLNICINILLLIIYLLLSYYFFTYNYIMFQSFTTGVFASLYIQNLNDFNFNVKKALNYLKNIF